MISLPDYRACKELISWFIIWIQRYNFISKMRQTQKPKSSKFTQYHLCQTRNNFCTVFLMSILAIHSHFRINILQKHCKTHPQQICLIINFKPFTIICIVCKVAYTCDLHKNAMKSHNNCKKSKVI